MHSRKLIKNEANKTDAIVLEKGKRFIVSQTRATASDLLRGNTKKILRKKENKRINEP